MNKGAKALAILAFLLVIGAFVFALISDFTIFSDQIKGFFGGIVGAIVIFILGFFLWLISIFLVFGVPLTQNNGFWPLKWASNAFHEALSQNPLSESQISTFTIIRIAIIVICASAFILAILALAVNHRPKAKGAVALGILSILFSIFGVLASVVMMKLIA